MTLFYGQGSPASRVQTRSKKKKQKKQFTFNRQVPKSTHFVDSPLQYGETW